MKTRTVIAVILAGILGTLANAIAAAIVVAPERIELALVPGRYIVAILVAMLLPVLFTSLSRNLSAILAFIFLTAIPSLLAKLFFAAAAPWSLVLGLNAVYALVALAAYVLIARPSPKS